MAEPFTSTVDIPFWLEVIAIVAGSMAGALRAITEQMAISGVIALAVALGLGGGIIRDTLLQDGTPVAFTDPWFLVIAVGAGVSTLLLAPVLERVTWVLVSVDALAVGIYAVLGADKALLYDLPPVGAALIGILAGTGGAILADLAVGVPPTLFRPGALLGVAAALGVGVYVAGFELTDERAAWFVIGVAVVTVVRIASVATGRGAGSVTELTEMSERAWSRAPLPGRAKTVLYVGPGVVETDDDPPRACLEVRGSETEPWQLVDGIDGFAHVPGTSYVLEVVDAVAARGAPGEGRPRYRLVRVLDANRPG